MLRFCFSIAKPRMQLKKNLIQISSSAADRIQYLMNQQNDPSIVKAIKIGVRKRGCNGLSYTMNYCSEPEKFDEVVEDKGVKVVIDSKAVMVLVGTEMDYVEDDIKAEFVFKNPNQKGSCGCGESFHI
ncbi:hypothetical protein pb186bvf_011399 [Paramecium bursaria]